MACLASLKKSRAMPTSTIPSEKEPQKKTLPRANKICVDPNASWDRKRLAREIVAHRLCKKKLAASAGHYLALLDSSRKMQYQARLLAQQVLMAQEEERREISRELHDEVAQILASINVQLSALRESSALGDRSLRGRVAKTQRMVSKSVEIVHRFARELRPTMLDDLGLIPALRAYIRDLPMRKTLKISFAAHPGVEALDNLRRTVLYRVTQEALTNISRHAHAKNVRVRLTQTPGMVRLSVHDDGKSFLVSRAFEANKGKRLGLLGMRERVEMVGGSFSIESTPTKGTTVHAQIPVLTKSLT